MLPGVPELYPAPKEVHPVTRHKLDERIRFQIELALAGPCACLTTIAGQEAAARRLGLSGAEVDLARDGRSFDVKTSSVLALVRATRAGDSQALAAARRQARTAGVARLELLEVEQIARSFPAEEPSKLQ